VATIWQQKRRPIPDISSCARTRLDRRTHEKATTSFVEGGEAAPLRCPRHSFFFPTSDLLVPLDNVAAELVPTEETLDLPGPGANLLERERALVSP